MKKWFLLIAAVVLAMGAQAQPKYERKDFTFKATKVKDGDGNISEITFGTYAGGKLIKEYTFELSVPLSEDLAATVGRYSEEDINFDGYPDVEVYLGYYGGFSTNTQQEALLWDQAQHQFVYPEGYAGNGELMPDEDNKYLVHTGSAGPDERYTSYYRWHGHKLVHYLDEIWAIESDDDNPISPSMTKYPLQRYNAKLDGRISVTIAFQKNEDNTVAGYIYYPKAKNPAPIMVVGSVSRHNETDFYTLNEYQPDGKVSGFITLEHKLVDGWDYQVQGTWTNPKTGKEMKITDVSFNRECPKWFTSSLLTPEDPGNIGREYSFQRWRDGYDDYMGGHISFKAAGKNKVHFECANVVNNIAEGKSSEGRPAVLKGNSFEYREVNGCHYAFRAVFYPQFVVLKTISGHETLDCFGAHSAFDGIYIKVKQ